MTKDQSVDYIKFLHFICPDNVQDYASRCRDSRWVQLQAISEDAIPMKIHEDEVDREKLILICASGE
ncbi:hypothetical protein TREES_T100015172 [Tupaia chinensis]|uniref:Uncharacterized protein n=1 Tax=Tupaia chinensis TaxID=246437 RepID=L9JEX7_TUPCH|nr:hypothetical protein TREES_T100015172 [Tupaia chinensis]